MQDGNENALPAGSPELALNRAGMVLLRHPDAAQRIIEEAEELQGVPQAWLQNNPRSLQKVQCGMFLKGLHAQLAAAEAGGVAKGQKEAVEAAAAARAAARAGVVTMEEEGGGEEGEGGGEEEEQQEEEQEEEGEG